MQIALIPSEDVQLVPGSHARWDTPAEYDVRCADGRKRSTHEMPGSLRASLGPGDAVMFNSWVGIKLTIFNYETHSSFWTEF